MKTFTQKELEAIERSLPMSKIKNKDFYQEIPIYVEFFKLIIAGVKKFEYRKTSKKIDTSKTILYISVETGQPLGYAKFEKLKDPSGAMIPEDAASREFVTENYIEKGISYEPYKIIEVEPVWMVPSIFPNQENRKKEVK